jgi:hypothetical protein
VQIRQISNFQARTAQSINRCYTGSQLKKNEKKRIPNKKIAQPDYVEFMGPKSLGRSLSRVNHGKKRFFVPQTIQSPSKKGTRTIYR